MIKLIKDISGFSSSDATSNKLIQLIAIFLSIPNNHDFVSASKLYSVIMTRKDKRKNLKQKTKIKKKIMAISR